MKHSKWRSFPLAGLATLMLIAANSHRARCEEKIANEPVSPALDAEVGKADLAYGLIDYGRKHKTPEALVTAVMILSKLAVVDGDSKDENPKLSESHFKDLNKLLSEAAAMRANDKLLGELVERSKESLKEASRGGGVPGIKDIIKKYKKQLDAKVKTLVGTLTKKKGETISASSDNRNVQISILAVQPNGTETELISGRGFASVVAKENGNYRIKAIPVGTVGVQTEFSLK